MRPTIASPTGVTDGVHRVRRIPSSRDAALLGVLGAVSAAMVAAVVAEPEVSRLPGPAGIGSFVSGASAAGALFVAGRNRGSWRGARLLGAAVAASSLVQVVGFAVLPATSDVATAGIFAGSLAVLILGFLAMTLLDFLEHVEQGRAEILSDIALVATVAGGITYLMLRSGGLVANSGWALVLMICIAVTAVLLVSARGVLLMWCPSLVHLGLLGAAGMLAVAGILLVHVANLGAEGGWPAAVGLLSGLATLGAAAVLVVEPRAYRGTPRPPLAATWIRLVLLALSMGAAWILLALALMSHPPLGSIEAGVLIIVVTATVTARTIMNQIELARGKRSLGRALEATELGLSSLQAAADAIASSEERLRLLLDSAVDGIVELDESGTIVRANAAFCAMVGLQSGRVVGKTWAEMAAGLAGGESLADLPIIGEAVLTVAGATCYVEARSSSLPTNPPGRLLLIRDVTASRTAERTIRTLFQFLQDRDEDRTRLLKRTNSAIEAERNRIARDLHDGPIQGISGVSLSLQAVRMMIESGDPPRAAETLGRISQELSEQAGDLRRLMSDLRPPVLEERGLFPAVRELAGRMRRETGVKVIVTGVPGAEPPTDVQTLGYRVAQEALSNVTKHAGATKVSIRLEAAAGMLHVEVSDDGRGFDPAQARDFLYRGKVGLASMRERAELAGGTLIVQSRPGGGTRILASLPFEILATAPRLDGDDLNTAEPVDSHPARLA